jgi:hypothetical protein
MSDPSRRSFLAAAGLAGTGLLAAGATPLATRGGQPPNLKLPDVIDKTVGFAVVGIGQLALEEILPAFAL